MYFKKIAIISQMAEEWTALEGSQEQVWKRLN
jgi:hypothetical protein